MWHLFLDWGRNSCVTHRKRIMIEHNGFVTINYYYIHRISYTAGLYINARALLMHQMDNTMEWTPQCSDYGTLLLCFGPCSLSCPCCHSILCTC